MTGPELDAALEELLGQVESNPELAGAAVVKLQALQCRLLLQLSIDLRSIFRTLEVDTSTLVCAHCGCSDKQSCTPPCSWVSIDPPVCSSKGCVAKEMADRGASRVILPGD